MRSTTSSTRIRAWRRPLAVLTALMAAGMGVSGCSLLPGAGGPSTQTLADGSGFLVAAPTNGGSDVGITGRLALVGGDCVGLDSPGEQTSALAFPAGTRSSDDGRAIVLPDGVEVRVGDLIFGGRDSTTASSVPDAFQPWPDAPSGCVQATYLTSIYDVTLDQGGQGF